MMPMISRTALVAWMCFVPCVGFAFDYHEPLRGFAVVPSVSVDVFENASGGIETGARVLASYDLGLDINTADAGWWQNGHLRFDLFGIAGSSPSAIVGDFQTLDNVDAPQSSKLLEAYYEHFFLDQHLSVLAGLYLQDAEFEVLNYACLFINSSFGVTPELAQIGPSIYPTPSFGTRIKYQFDGGWYAMGAIYDGEPGDLDRPRGTHIEFKKGDGVITSFELGWIHGEPNKTESGAYTKFGAGGWHSTNTFDDFGGVNRDSNAGVYVIGERALTDQLGMFAQLGIAMGDRNQLGSYVGAGFNYTGLLPGRPDDVFGLGFAHARNTDRFLSNNAGFERAETAVELTYCFSVLDHITVQPDLQYIINPGTDPALDDAVVIGARVGLEF
ncbi:MAG: carbohydrate porin [Gammaproteobacteria bacterium]